MLSKNSTKKCYFPNFRAPFDQKTLSYENFSTDESDDQNFSGQFYGHKKYPKHHTKEKLQLCKKFMANGFCPYYDRCKFAHGSHQLRKNNQTNNRYKTKLCGAFFNDGCCYYGDRCNFLHKKNQSMLQCAQMTLKRQNFKDFFLTLRKQSRLLQILNRQA